MEHQLNQTSYIASRPLDQNDHIEPLANPKHNDIEVDFQEQKHVKQLKNKVLFAVQGLGSVNTIIRNGKKFETYIKGPFCEQSVKDLVKYLRNDKAECEYVRITLCDYNIIQSDLLELLTLHLEDKKLTFWLIALMALMTNRPHKHLAEAEQQKIRKSLIEYKQSFVKHEVLTNLIVHIADYFKIPKEHRFTAYLQMLQFSLVLIRNLLQVKDATTEEQLHFRFVLAMIREEIFSPILYLIQLKDHPQVLDKVQILLMEICYHTFTCFEPQLVYQSSKKKSNLSLVAAQAKKTHKTITRHSRFMPMFQKKAVYSRKLVHQLTTTASQNLANQRKIPQRVCELMKIQKIGHRYLPENFMIMQQQGEGGTTKVKTTVFQLCKQFLEIEYEQLCRLIFPLIKSNSQKLSEQHLLQYILLAEWAITMTTTKYRSQLANASSPLQRTTVEYDLMQIVYVVQSEHFQHLYNMLFTEVTRKLKRQFKHTYFNAELSLFYRYIQVIAILKQSSSISDRKNAVVLMGYMFKHQIARVLKLAFECVVEVKVKKLLIIIIELFFTLLEEYTHGRAITVTTNRQLRSKIAKQKEARKNERDPQSQMIEREMIEAYPEGYQGFIGSQNQEYLGLQQKIKKNKQIEVLNSQQPRFQQKKCNIVSEFACIASYEIIEQYLFVLKKQNINLQETKLIKSIFYYFQKVVSLLKGEWLFFQTNTLTIFQQLLQNRELDDSYKNIIRHVCKCFVKLLRTNSLALAQSLFRFPSLAIKDQIMNNYEKAKQTVPFQRMNQQKPFTNNGFTQNFSDNGTVIPEVSANEPHTLQFGHSQFLGSYDMPF